MGLQLAYALVKPTDIFHQPDDFALNDMGLLAHTGIFQDCLNDLNRQHQQ